MTRDIRAGEAVLRFPLKSEPEGDFVTLEGRRFCRIEGVDRMPPFFMTVVSASDHWMFIGSNGTLAAGRRNSRSSLFPYYTSDKILDSGTTTGPLSAFLVDRGGVTRLWMPFAEAYAGVDAVERTLYKSVTGDTIVFEERNRDLGLVFTVSWAFSDRWGFVRRSSLANAGAASCRISLLDGVRNVLPHGIEPDAQNLYSNLLDAYKRSEYREDAGLAVFALSSRLTDKAEPSEALRATTAWHAGLPGARIALSPRQVASFATRGRVDTETDICGDRCCFLLNADLDLAPGARREWRLVLEVNQDHAAVANLAARLVGDREAALADLDADVRVSAESLRAIIGCADGLQCTGSERTSAHHYANVLFNTMRGGIYADGYRLDRRDVFDYLKKANAPAFAENERALASLPASFSLDELKAAADRAGLPDLQRLSRQYLPLTFSWRHGDPSRPWNQFSINVRNADGSKRLDYQGNWRDIFQNWEALNLSYPGFFESSICTFLNFTTADGYNPYRVSRDGIDWEKPEPHNPWANIGYWGDHQIIYLLKLLEWCEAFQPEVAARLLDRRVFSHAQVPYRIRPYESIVADPFNTIDFDHALDEAIEARVKHVGFDGRLLPNADGSVRHATMIEKLLILLLTKLSNYVPGAGIWMNTQRPEWNDANNALVGRGASVVTLAYLRRFSAFLQKLMATAQADSVSLEASLGDFLAAVRATLDHHDPAVATAGDAQRRAVMDELGRAGSAYRNAYYEKGLGSGTTDIAIRGLDAFLERVLRWIDEGLRANRREDGLYHAYNILAIGPGAAGIVRLKEMLEGQVAVLSSGALSAADAVALLDALRRSELYRADQDSYILYPNHPPPGFLHKNTIPAEKVAATPLLRQLIARGDTRLVVADVSGAVHFQGVLRNRNDVNEILDRIEASGVAVGASRDGIIALFEEIFDHARYTGRSGTFFAYEGLGSIYWHMVSKLLLAAQENYFRAVDAGEASPLVDALRKRYQDIRAGLGFNKSAGRYGAFPTDPYSHTPWGRGAQQPGMTGQVKEEVLTRLGELGVRVCAGDIRFEPSMLRDDEWLREAMSFEYIDASGAPRAIEVPAGGLAFTFAQVPVVYVRSTRRRIHIARRDGTTVVLDGTSCGPEACASILRRDGTIVSLRVETETGRG